MPTNPHPSPINPDPTDPDPRPKPEPQVPCVTVPVPEGTVNLLDPIVIAKMVERGEEENAAQRGLNADHEIQILTQQIRILADMYLIDAETMSTVRRQAIENWEHDHNGGEE